MRRSKKTIAIFGYKQWLMSMDMKTKLVQHVMRINISISHWHLTCDMWHNNKYSLLSLHMNTKVVQHVPRINISIWHDMPTQTQSPSQTQSQLVPSFCKDILHFYFISSLVLTYDKTCHWAGSQLKKFIPHLLLAFLIAWCTCNCN